MMVWNNRWAAIDYAEVQSECHENQVPAFVEGALETLYGSVFSTLAQMRQAGRLTGNTSTYAASLKGALISLLLYRREKGAVRVLNEVIFLDRNEILYFARTIFARYSDVSAIFFHAIETGMEALPLPSRRSTCLDDFVLPLPASEEAYLASLGNSTRATIHRYLAKLKRDHPSFQHLIAENDMIDPCSIETIADMNKVRITRKGKVCTVDTAYRQQLAALARHGGLVNLIVIDGQIRAGVIVTGVGKNFFMHMIAHDPDYDAYRLGILCCYLNICECIRRGGRTYHFLWGESAYKDRLGGRRHTLESLAVLRSPWGYVLHARVLLPQQCAAYVRASARFLLQGRGGSLNRHMPASAQASPRNKLLAGIRRLAGRTSGRHTQQPALTDNARQRERVKK